MNPKEHLMSKLMTKIFLIALLASLLNAQNEEVLEEIPADSYEIQEVSQEASIIEEVPAPSTSMNAPSNIVDNSAPSSNNVANDPQTDEYVIPNTPLLRASNIIIVRAVGMGVSPENTISPAQAMVMAKRAAIVDAYRQVGEKMYGIKLNAKDTIKDAVSKNSTVRTKVNAIIRNAEIVESKFKDGLFQVEMEVKLDGRRWYRVLSGF